MFTQDEVELLMEALDALESKKSTDSLLKGIFKTMLSPTEEGARKAAEDVGQEVSKGDPLLRDRIILLKAKLIGVRDRMEVSDL